MRLFMERPNACDEKEFIEMMHEWEALNERITPGMTTNYKPDFQLFLNLLENCHNGKGLKNNQVPSTLFILKNEEGRVFGASSLRHYLNEELKVYGGHIGYGVRPSERNKGYATKMLELTLLKAREMGLNQVTICCDKENLASSIVIQKNGGILQFDGKYEPLNRKIKQFVINVK